MAAGAAVAEYTATVKWTRKPSEVFTDNKYSRAHEWEFDGGVTVPASSSPHVVKLPLSNAAAVDPEEAFVASLASCHMLFFLSFAAMKKFTIESYVDRAVGVLGRNDAGRQAMLRVVLHPDITFSGTPPSADELRALHDRAHHECYIANSVTTTVEVEPV
jgi:organic hydroperoxide reductase OsmC/OhrA